AGTAASVSVSVDGGSTWFENVSSATRYFSFGQAGNTVLMVKVRLSSEDWNTTPRVYNISVVFKLGHTQGDTTSSIISPSRIWRWNSIVIKTSIPSQASVKLSILNETGNPIVGFENLNVNAGLWKKDIPALDALYNASLRRIYLRLTLTTLDPMYSPEVEWIAVYFSSYKEIPSSGFIWPDCSQPLSGAVPLVYSAFNLTLLLNTSEPDNSSFLDPASDWTGMLQYAIGEMDNYSHPPSFWSSSWTTIASGLSYPNGTLPPDVLHLPFLKPPLYNSWIFRPQNFTSGKYYFFRAVVTDGTRMEVHTSDRPLQYLNNLSGIPSNPQILLPFLSSFNQSGTNSSNNNFTNNTGPAFKVVFKMDNITLPWVWVELKLTGSDGSALLINSTLGTDLYSYGLNGTEITRNFTSADKFFTIKLPDRTLKDGTSYTATARIYNGANWSGYSDPASFTVDVSPPNMPSPILSYPTDTTLINITTANGTRTIRATNNTLLTWNWSAPYDISGISQYFVDAGVEGEPARIFNRTIVNSTSFTMDVSAYPSGWRYVIRVAAADCAGNAGNYSEESEPVLVDTSSPVYGYINDSGPYTVYTDFIYTSFYFADHESGVAGYHVRVGTSVQGDDVLPDVYTEKDFMNITGLSLQLGTKYYISVRAKNNVGIWSSWHCSAGVICDPTYGNIPPAPVITIPQECKVGEEVILNASLSYDPDGFIVRYHWDTGDGKEYSSTMASHSWIHSGIYRVVLTVTDNRGVNNSKEAVINVREADFVIPSLFWTIIYILAAVVIISILVVISLKIVKMIRKKQENERRAKLALAEAEQKKFHQEDFNSLAVSGGKEVGISATLPSLSMRPGSEDKNLKRCPLCGMFVMPGTHIKCICGTVVHKNCLKGRMQCPVCQRRF
ncbi:MAG: PKD domain-containing protein, partial [Thermoplasmata archaeon]